MRRIFFTVLLSSLLLPLQSFAASPAASGDLIKGSGSTVYYFGATGKRYVFPTEKTYFSWYADFAGIKTISDSELASYPLGGNVTYRPGVKLVKITTDPKVYAVAKGGTLRWVQTEAVASTLYGTDWAKKVDDIPDPFFINYVIGVSIASATDYSPSGETSAATSINVDKNLQSGSIPAPPPPGPPAPAPTPNPYTVTLSVSNSSPKIGDIVTFSASASPSQSLSTVKLFFDGLLQRSCEFTPCTTDVIIPSSGTKPNYDFRADVAWIDAHTESVTTTIAVTDGQSSGLTLTITHPEVKPNTLREIVVDADRNFIAKYLDIFIDGGDVRGCTGVQQCRYSDYETSPIGTVHSVYAIGQDANGFQKRTATQTFSVVQNDHPVLTVTPGKTALFRGETLDVTVSANDSDGINWTEVWLDGSLLKHCDSSLCTVIAGPWSESRTLNFVGRAQDTLGLVGSGTSTTVTVQ